MRQSQLKRQRRKFRKEVEEYREAQDREFEKVIYGILALSFPWRLLYAWKIVTRTYKFKHLGDKQ
jgi:hypothetical protein